MILVDTAASQKPVVVIAGFALTIIPLYYGAWQYRSSRRHGIEVRKQISVWSEAWIDEWLDTQVVQPLDVSPLRRYCESSTWRPELVFDLADANGGIGNIRANYLDFIFYTIEAGASMMLPKRATRSQEDLSNVWSGSAEFDTFFDEEWFLEAMQAACPQMAIYKPPANDTKLVPGRYQPRSRRTDRDVTRNKGTYLQELDTWLSGQKGYTKDERMIVSVGRTIWEYDTRGLPYGVRRAMGQLLTINPTIRHLAAHVVRQLARSFHLDIIPTDPIPQNMFFGAHLRTETDAAKAGWLNAPNTDFSAQTDAYILQTVQSGLDVMYVASGNASELERFKEKAAAHRPPLIVTSKLDLMDQEQLDVFNQLTWDQQALVDYEILQRCSVFGGFVRSSFSYNIALTRNQWLEDHGLAIDPWVVLHSEAGVAFDDGISRVIGRDKEHEKRIPRGMWP